MSGQWMSRSVLDGPATGLCSIGWVVGGRIYCSWERVALGVHTRCDHRIAKKAALSYRAVFVRAHDPAEAAAAVSLRATGAHVAEYSP